MLKKLLVVATVLVLVGLPLAARRFYFYEGRYEPAEVPRPDLSSIKAPLPDLEPFTDQYTAAEPGVILVDGSHSNRLELAELNVLQARLAARGQQLEQVVASEEWPKKLRYAKAVVIVGPGEDWTSAEIEQIEEFVDKGGRLLLVTDPTRYEVLLDETGAFVGYDQDAGHINPLASRFGLFFQADYLYNTSENEGNFRNIELTEFGDQELTQGLDEVVFYATHSILSDEPPLIATNGETRSSSSERAETLTVAALAAGGNVLAIGDLTFMTEPYNAAYDNDQFVAHIADFLSGTQRRYDLADFPLFFGDEVDLVFAGDPLLDSDLLSSSSTLQSLFAEQGKVLTVQQSEDKQRDTLFLGLYENAEEVEPYLDAAAVTLLITPTQTAGDKVTRPLPTVSPPSLAPTKSLTTTVPVTPALGIQSPAAGGAKSGIAATGQATPSPPKLLEIGSVGDVLPTGTCLLALQGTGERQVLVVLADKKKGLEDAVKRLKEGNLEGCLLREMDTPAQTTLALCSTGEVTAGQGTGGWQTPSPGPTPAPPTPTVAPASKPITDTVAPSEPVGDTAGRILIVALDKGEARYAGLTGSDDFAAILKSRYEVQVWSVAQAGSPGPKDLVDWDLIIWTAGDFEGAFGDTETALVFTLALEGVPLILSGGYFGSTGVDAVQRDIQVGDASHPICQGFASQEVIAFESAPAGVEYEIEVMEELGEGEGSALFVRGPSSEESGAPSVFVSDGGFGDGKVVYIAFPIYLLPEEARSRLVLNTVAWMLAP